MRMADQRGVRCVRLAFVQEGFKPSCGPVEEEGFDSVGHNSFYHSTQPSSLSRQQETLTATDAKDAKEIGVNGYSLRCVLCALCGEPAFG